MDGLTIQPDSLQNHSTPKLSSKPLPNGVSVNGKAKAAPAVETSARIDLRPLYVALKDAVGENWASYKEAVKEFMLGQLNQVELSLRIDHFICISPDREHLHNNLVAAIFGNATRAEAPDSGIASWVSANDKPTAVSKPVSGDVAEQRLKTEVMHLTARERRRLKGIVEEPSLVHTQPTQTYHTARRIHLPDTTPSSAGAGFNKTNWDIEIRRRYTQPLFSETHELPDADTLTSRITPICYEEGLPSGCAPSCAELVTVACDTYVKEALRMLFSRVFSNGDGLIRTANYKKKLQREENAWLENRDGVHKSATGLLPVEMQSLRERRVLGLDDLRLGLNLGDAYWGQQRLISGGILVDGYSEGFGSMAGHDGDGNLLKKKEAVVNGHALTTGFAATSTFTNGAGTGGAVDGDPMQLDEPAGWQGGTNADHEHLDSVLDRVLAFAP